MSNTESFVDEVNEDLRRDRLFHLMRRYGWIAVLLVLLIVGGTAYREWSRAQESAAAEARGDALLAAIEIEDAAARASALAETNRADQSALTQLAEASSHVEAGDQGTALAVLDAIASDASLPELYRDLALLKSALLTEAHDAEARRAALAPISAPGRPFALLAQEQSAMIDLEEGAQEAAIATLRAIYDNAEVSRGQKQRLNALLTALGAAPEEAAAATEEQG